MSCPPGSVSAGRKRPSCLGFQSRPTDRLPDSCGVLPPSHVRRAHRRDDISEPLVCEHQDTALSRFPRPLRRGGEPDQPLDESSNDSACGGGARGIQPGPWISRLMPGTILILPEWCETIETVCPIYSIYIIGREPTLFRHVPCACQGGKMFNSLVKHVRLLTYTPSTMLSQLYHLSN